MTFESLAARLRSHRQEHVLRFWDRLDDTRRQSLAAQLEAIDLAALHTLWSAAAVPAPRGSAAERAARARAPKHLVRVAKGEAEQAAWREARQTGEELLRAGRVGAILVAGGEGSRLGFPHPKGMFPIGTLSGKSLFELLAGQLLARGRRAGRPIPWYVMTSAATHDETAAFFSEHNGFGLARGDVSFFQQGSMPSVEVDTGRLLLAEPHEIATNPDGHGGVLEALRRSGCLDDMRRRGIDFVYYHQVDNPLATVCDPAFLGWHAREQSEVTTVAVAKLSPEERQGVLCDVDGSTEVIEYSDLPDEAARRRDERSELVLWAGSTAIHAFSRSFLDRLEAERIELPFHRARKKVPFIDEQGKSASPEKENAIKFERFVFDVLPLCAKALVVEARREEQFCPLKNRTGDFSAAHVQHSLSRLYASWLRSAGIALDEYLPVEISPLYALDADELKAKTPRDLPRNRPVYLA